MANNKDAKIERARKFADAGQYVKAIEAWRELLDDSPNDANVYNTIGDLCLKKKSNSDAADAYSKAARFYLQEGFHLKAIALYKKILKLEPNRAEIYTLLGDLNIVRGLMNNAVADYLSGAKLYLKTGQAMNALTLFRKITKVDPKNTDMRLRVAELCLKEKLTDEAIDEYLRIGREYQRLERAEDARKLYEQILALSPNHAEARRRLDTPYQPGMDEPEAAAPALEEITVSTAMQSAVELQASSAPAPPPAGEGPQPTLTDVRRALTDGDVTQAEKLIRTLLVENPDNDDCQAMLGQVYLRKGHASIAFDILHPIAKAWLDRGRRQEAIEIIDAFLAVEPEDADFHALKAQASGEGVGAGAGISLDPGASMPAGFEAPQAEQPAAAQNGQPAGSIEFSIEENLGLRAPSAPAPASAVEVPELEVSLEAATAAEEFVESPAPAASAAATAEQPFDLGVVLQEAVSEAAPSAASAPKTTADLDAIFDAFRQGIKGQVGDGDFETHYDLGIAYKEMGLTVEAIEEFQLAARGPTRFVDACTMIAACHKDRRQAQSAIAILERALADSRCAGPGVPYVKYDLAVLYEEEGQVEKAARLYADIPSVRDVEERRRRLSGKEEPIGQAAAGGKRPVSYL